MNKQGICVIYVNYNNYKQTIESSLKIQKMRLIKRIIIVDNHSTDDSYQYLKKIENEKISVILCEENKGFSVGNNFGCCYARGKYNDFNCFLFLGTDVDVEENVIQIAYDYLEEKQCAAVSPRILELDGMEGCSAWQFPSFSKILRMCLWNYSRKHQLNEMLNLPKEGIVMCDSIRGSFILIKKEDFFLVDGFDEDTFLYYEENILFKKLERYNKKPIVICDCFYKHNHDTKKNTNNYFSKIHNNKSAYIYLTKYHNISPLKKIIYKIFSCFGLIEIKIVGLIKKIIRK